MRMPPEWHARNYARESRWKGANARRNSRVKAAWHKARYTRCWKPGERVAVEFAGVRCLGRVVDYVGHAVILVRLDGGTELVYGAKRWHQIEQVKEAMTA